MRARREGLERTAARQLTEVAHDTLDEVTEAVATAQKDLGAWARQDVMRDVIIGDLDKRIARFLRSLVDGGAPFLSLVCFDRDGRVVAASDPRWAAEGSEDERGAHGARRRRVSGRAGPGARRRRPAV